MQRSTARRDWEQVPPNPDLHEDLGYELRDLESYEVDEDRVLFLPKDEDMNWVDAFIIIKENALHSLD